MNSDEGITDMLKSTLTKLKNEKNKIESLLNELKEASADGNLSAADARYVIELNLAEYKKVRTKAKPILLKRILRKMFSAIVVGRGSVKVAYGTTSERTVVGRDHLRLVASDENSGATGPSPFSKRRLVKTQEIKNPPNHPLVIADEEVMGGYILLNGGLERVRTYDLLIRSQVL